LNNNYLLDRFKGGMGVSFHFHHPKDAQACNRLQCEEPRPKVVASSKEKARFDWGYSTLWIDGGETGKRPPYPQRVIEPAKIKEAISETRYYAELK
jgi:hypothetical protein